MRLGARIHRWGNSRFASRPSSIPAGAAGPAGIARVTQGIQATADSPDTFGAVVVRAGTAAIPRQVHGLPDASQLRLRDDLIGLEGNLACRPPGMVRPVLYANALVMTLPRVPVSLWSRP